MLLVFCDLPTNQRTFERYYLTTHSKCRTSTRTIPKIM